MVGPQPEPKALEHAFRLEVYKMLKKEGKISDAVIGNMLNWHHGGFNIFYSKSTDPDDQNGNDCSQHCVFRPHPATRSGLIRPLNPVTSGQLEGSSTS